MNQTTIIIIAVVILLLSSSSIGAYFMMSGEEEKPKTEPAAAEAPAEKTPTPAAASVSTPAAASVSTPAENTPAAAAASVSTPAAASVSTPAVSTPVPILANPGEAISCTGYNPKGSGAIYRYDGDKKMRHYPNPDIAGSWDSNWSSGATRILDCTGFTLGDDMVPKGTLGPTVNWAGKEFSTDGRCGPQFGNKACTGKSCCSQFGWCGGSTGQNDDWCGKFKGFNGEYNGEKP
jgi:hypothetical protein